ncbi:hypothetical protein PROFUN_00773 [Planoprotostelium fungivorum]|uniref:Uncharacterized protein n=1 Tax=Planoprotostelium fungivorum TaxID=1890364 RepID=A0A2P6P010_9EUKA|nr:hypothetical protein PROFUN_00773 [Planoprotostelium fungivorum]
MGILRGRNLLWQLPEHLIGVEDSHHLNIATDKCSTGTEDELQSSHTTALKQTSSFDFMKEDANERIPPYTKIIKLVDTRGSNLQFRPMDRAKDTSLKVSIHGHRGTGKTCLWRRFQELPFVENYSPTLETQSCSITWSYKGDTSSHLLFIYSYLASDDLVQVDIMDVSEKGKEAESHQAEIEGMDVNAIIIMIDPTKPFTFQYARVLLDKIPSHIDILVLSNFRDMAEKRVVSEGDIREWVNTINGSEKRSTKNVHFLETSMNNRYGTKTIASFLNLPYVRLQRAMIEEQLVRNAEEMSSVETELSLLSREQNYEFYLKWLEQTNRNRGSRPSVSSNSLSLSSNRPSTSNAPSTEKSTPGNLSQSGRTLTLSQPASTTQTTPTNPLSSSGRALPEVKKEEEKKEEKKVEPPKAVWNPPTPPSSVAPPPKKGFFQRLFSKDTLDLEAETRAAKARIAEEEAKKTQDSLKQLAALKKGGSQNLDEFAPVEESLPDGFLDDTDDFYNSGKGYDDEEEEFNSLVTKEIDEVEDFSITRKVLPKKENKPNKKESENRAPVKAATTAPSNSKSTTQKEEKKAPTKKEETIPPLKKEETITKKQQVSVAVKEEKRVEQKKEEEAALDDFAPDDAGALDFDDEEEKKEDAPKEKMTFGSDSDDEVNPLVAGDSDDDEPKVIATQPTKGKKEEEKKKEDEKRKEEEERAKKAIEEQKRKDKEKREQMQRQREEERKKKKKEEEEKKKKEEEKKKKKEERKKKEEEERRIEEERRVEEERRIEEEERMKENELNEGMKEEKKEELREEAEEETVQKEEQEEKEEEKKRDVEEETEKEVEKEKTREVKTEERDENGGVTDEDEPVRFEELMSGGEEENTQKYTSEFDINFHYPIKDAKGSPVVKLQEEEREPEIFSDYNPEEDGDISGFLSETKYSSKEETEPPRETKKKPEKKKSVWGDSETDEEENPYVNREGWDDSEEEKEEKRETNDSEEEGKGGYDDMSGTEEKTRGGYDDMSGTEEKGRGYADVSEVEKEGKEEEDGWGVQTQGGEEDYEGFDSPSNYNALRDSDFQASFNYEDGESYEKEFTSFDSTVVDEEDGWGTQVTSPTFEALDSFGEPSTSSKKSTTVKKKGNNLPSVSVKKAAKPLKLDPSLAAFLEDDEPSEKKKKSTGEKKRSTGEKTKSKREKTSSETTRTSTRTEKPKAAEPVKKSVFYL